MWHNSEVYLTKKNISKEEWHDLVNIISNYNGLLRKWKIIIINEKNQIRYFIKTKCSLPATINNLNSYILKPIKGIKIPKVNYTLPLLPKVDSNVIDLINYTEIRNKGCLKYLKIDFFKLYENKIISKISVYIKKKNLIKKYVILFGIPSTILSVDFESNKRYFYKKSPKYLEISKILHLLNTDSNNALLSVDTFPYLQGKFYLNQNNFSFDKHSIVIGSSGCGKSKFISLLVNNIYKNKSLRYNSKLERVLRHSIHLLLTDEGFNFRNLRKLILDLEYRNEIIKRLKSKLPFSVIDFFSSDFNDLKTKSYNDAISPIIGFIDEMEMLPVFSSEKINDNLKKTINDNFLTLFSLDRTKLGNKVTKTISGLIMQQLLTIIQSKEIDKHIIFIIDEVPVVENPILARYLSEARKYNLSLVLAGQYFNQISDELKNSIFANTVNYYIFRVSKLDANLLVDNFNMKIPLDNSKEQKIKLLTELQTRECIVRIDRNGILLPAFKGVTLDYKSIPRIKEEVKAQNVIKEQKVLNNKTNFHINNISLKSILISNSSSRKVVKE